MLIKKRRLVVLLIFLFHKSIGQVNPAEAATLHSLYTVMQVSPVEKAKDYTFKIANAHYNDEREFNKHIAVTKNENKSSFLNRLPAFNTDYTWQVIYNGSTGKKIGASPLYHFKIAALRIGDTSRKYRLRVLENKYNDSLLFFLDCAKAMYDLKGNAVWRLPEILPDVISKNVVTDLKPSPFNTITFIAGDNCYEVTIMAKCCGKAME